MSWVVQGPVPLPCFPDSGHEPQAVDGYPDLSGCPGSELLGKATLLCRNTCVRAHTCTHAVVGLAQGGTDASLHLEAETGGSPIRAVSTASLCKGSRVDRHPVSGQFAERHSRNGWCLPAWSYALGPCSSSLWPSPQLTRPLASQRETLLSLGLSCRGLQAVSLSFGMRAPTLLLVPKNKVL